MSEERVLSKGSQREELAVWKALVAEFQTPSIWRASWQIVNTLGSYLLLWYFIYLSLSVSWWLTVPLAVLGGFLLVRAFIIFHDCGHGSYFKSKLANNICGFICGVLTFTPYRHWRWEHSRHHANAGNLDRRGIGDVWTMTVQEYLDASIWVRVCYRIARNPFALFIVAPLYLFLIHQRCPNLKASSRERLSVWWMNLSIIIMAYGMSRLFGFFNYMVIQMIILTVVGTAGVWLFYVQHQFEDVYWERGEEWDFIAAAMEGSSFYNLPRVMQWFSGNIGYHHIHHLSPTIPNYNLERCHESNPKFRNVTEITLLSSLKSISYRLWDESEKKLVGYRRLRELKAMGKG